MRIYSAIKRKILINPFIKKLLISMMLVYVLVQYFSTSTNQELKYEENQIVPGEALDPLVGKLNAKKHNSINSPDQPLLQHKNREKNYQNQEYSMKQSEKSPKPQESQILPAENREKSTSTKENRDNKESQVETKSSPTYSDSDIPGRMETSWSMAKAKIPDMEKVKFKPHAITNDTITLILMSSADKVFMSINKKEIYRGIEKRGIHIVVLNQYNGRVMAKRVFDTFNRGVENDMIEFLDDITPGRIIVFAVLDEISTGLTWKGRNKLKEHGCRFADQISYRDMWALVTRKDGLKIAETFSNVATADTGYEWGGPIYMRTDFDLEEKPVECQWPYSDQNRIRRAFCVRYEAYGKVCNCDIAYWEDTFVEIDKKLHEELSSTPLYNQIAVVILATNRPHELYRSLKSLMEASGFNKNLAVIYTERATPEVRGLAKLFGITLEETESSKTVKNSEVPTRIRHKMQRALRDITDAQFDPSTIPEGEPVRGSHPTFKAENILVLEEDIVVSPDIFKYFHSLYPIFKKDESVLAISAFNYHSYRMVADSQSTIYRSNDTHFLAILLPSRTIKEYLVPNWPSIANDNNEEWFRGLQIELEKDKDLLFPEVTRAKHSSYEGYAIRGNVQTDYFKDHMMSKSTQYSITEEDVDKLVLSRYEEALIKLIKNSEKLTYNFCKHDLIFGTAPYVMFIEYTQTSTSNWEYIMKCLKSWSAFPIGTWRDTWSLRFHGHPLIIVGHPTSPFSYLKPADYKTIIAPSTANETTTKPSHQSSKSSL